MSHSQGNRNHTDEAPVANTEDVYLTFVKNNGKIHDYRVLSNRFGSCLKTTYNNVIWVQKKTLFFFPTIFIMTSHFENFWDTKQSTLN